MRFKSKAQPLSQLDVQDDEEKDRKMIGGGRQQYEELDYMLSADFHSSY